MQIVDSQRSAHPGQGSGLEAKMRALYRYLPATALAQVIFNRGSDSQSNRHRGGTHGGMKFFTSEKSAVAHTFSLDWWCGRWGSNPQIRKDGGF